MTHNRSTEELSMRSAVEKWGRSRWPEARMVHELVVGQCRIDMAFIGSSHITGVEIKSGSDTLKRLDQQAKEYMAHLPEVWIAYAPKWNNQLGVPWQMGKLVVADDEVSEEIPSARPEYAFRHPADVNRSLTVPMLHILWKAELVALANHTRVSVSKKMNMESIIDELARRLTGDEIVSGVCRELRARNAFPVAPASDPPII